MQIQQMKYDITQCALYKCESKNRLAKLLLVSLSNLNKIITSEDNYYSFEQLKKDGTTRMIIAPREKLKFVQKRILNLLQKIIRPDWLFSGEKGKNYIDNGKYHKNSSCFLTIDIKSFYNNCNRERVYCFFTQKLLTSPDVAKILTEIIVHDFILPTGCPTSQMLAFYSYLNMFEEINYKAQEYGCLFSLYVDDMTFSKNSPFNHRRLANDVDIILRKYDHKPKYQKINYYSKKAFKLVTGTVITPLNTIVTPNNLRKKIIETFKKSTSETANNATLMTLRGQLQAAKNVDPDIFPEITRKTKKHN